MAEGKIYIANETFQAAGVDNPVYKNITRVREGHPILKQYPHLFRVAEAHLEWPDAEQATADPGTKRGDKTHA